MSLAAALVLAHRCAPSVAPETLLSVVQVESRFDSLAIGVNGDHRRVLSVMSATEASATATALITKGQNVDLGLAQINSRNLVWLGLSVEQAFDPCANLAAAARVLQSGYAHANAAGAGEQSALQKTFSLYNTGRSDRGFANGYVAKVMQAARHIIPALAVAPVATPEDESAKDPDPPIWDVFGRTGRHPASFVISVSTPASGGQP